MGSSGGAIGSKPYASRRLSPEAPVPFPPVIRVGLLTAFALVAVAGTAQAAPPTCASPEVRMHDEAVFGHFSTLGAARTLKASAAAAGFRGIKIEDDGCGGDFEVEIDGADTQKDRSSFAAE